VNDRSSRSRSYVPDSDSIPEVEAAEAARVVGAILNAGPSSGTADAQTGEMSS